MKRNSRMKKHEFEHCAPAQPKFMQPGAPYPTTAIPKFSQIPTSSAPFPDDVGVVLEGADSAFMFKSHTDGGRHKP